MWAIQFAWSPRFHCGDTEPSLALCASEMINGFFFYIHQIKLRCPVAYITAITGPAICSPISYTAHTVNATAHHGLVSALRPNHMKNRPCAFPILFANLTIIFYLSSGYGSTVHPMANRSWRISSVTVLSLTYP